MRVLITGGAGYIGTALTDLLTRQQFSVVILDNFSAGHVQHPTHVSPGVQLVEGNILNFRLFMRAARGADAIVHLAALVGSPACAADPMGANLTNIVGTRAVVDVAQRCDVPHVVFASTCSVYGKVTGQICSEADPAAPLTTYGRTKATGERLVIDSARGTILRFSTAFGVGPVVRDDLLIHHLVREAVIKKHIDIFEPAAIRPFVHLADIAASIEFTLRHANLMRNRIYNVGSPESTISKGNLADRLAQMTDATVTSTNDQTDPDGRSYWVSFDQLKNVGFVPKVEFNKGLAEVITHVRGGVAT